MDLFYFLRWWKMFVIWIFFQMDYHFPIQIRKKQCNFKQSNIWIWKRSKFLWCWKWISPGHFICLLLDLSLELNKFLNQWKFVRKLINLVFKQCSMVNGNFHSLEMHLRQFPMVIEYIGQIHPLISMDNRYW